MKRLKKTNISIKNLFFICAGGFVFVSAIVFIMISTIHLPDLKSFNERQIVNSTKIYDRTGTVLLYDVHQNVRRTDIPFADMGTYIKNATVAIEDSNFYQNKGIRPLSILRAILVNILSGHLSQGGSTITQQIVKNTLLTPEKTFSRKIKEWILAIKVDQSMSKEDILAIYLNEAPYGGNIYGIKEASKTFFDKEPASLTLAESAYLASIPKAPSLFYPYGNHRDKLDTRKNTVLLRMKDLKFITEDEYTKAMSENVVFAPQEKFGIKAPHFVFYIKDYLEQKYGADMVESGGLKVTTTLDWNLEGKAEATVNKYALQNEKDFDASNAALVALDPKTGQILSMVGSRNYFDKNIQGNFNVATAKRQPGSSFKPIIYATAFNQGYTPKTALFDVPIEFQTTCDAYGHAIAPHKQSECYKPQNYDDKNRGPMSIREALAQSINVPAVEMLYLVGMADALKTAKDMGIKSLNDPARYGLTLVIGGGEVSLLDMVGAYGVFANSGIRHEETVILKVEDLNGKVLEEYQDQETQALPKNTALMISDILSDNAARTPTFGVNSPLRIPGRSVAAKTGTTNNNKDAWLVGYTPSLAVGVWSGNNDNKPMKKSSASISGPLWNAYMTEVLSVYPNENFEEPIIPDDPSILKPVLRGNWQGGESYFIDTVSGKLATDLTPSETKKEVVSSNVHSTLYWIDKSNPLGPAPSNPEEDPQFNHWEISTQNWWNANKSKYNTGQGPKPSSYDDIHTLANTPKVSFLNMQSVYNNNSKINISLSVVGPYQVKKVDYFINNTFVGSSSGLNFSFFPGDISSINMDNTLRVVVYDSVYNRGVAESSFVVTF